MIRIVMADDEAPARNRLRTLLADHPDLQIAGEADSGDAALALILKEQPDGVILDITMPGISVFTTLAGIKDPPAVIFLTAHAEYAVDAFSFKAVDYLLKPVGRERFAQAMERLRSAVCARQGSGQPVIRPGGVESSSGEIPLTARAGSVIRVVDPDRVSCIVFREGFSFLRTDEGEFCSDLPLSHFEEVLGGKGFVRVSRQALVNTKKVEKIRPREGETLLLELEGGDRVAVSRRKAPAIRQFFGL